MLTNSETKSPDKFIDGNIRRYSEKKVAKVTQGVVAALSALLPTLAILVLYFVTSMKTRIGLVILFTTVFAVLLALFTSAKRVEIFSATAAFAAVEVVFVGSTAGVSGP